MTNNNNMKYIMMGKVLTTDSLVYLNSLVGFEFIFSYQQLHTSHHHHAVIPTVTQYKYQYYNPGRRYVVCVLNSCFLHTTFAFAILSRGLAQNVLFHSNEFITPLQTDERTSATVFYRLLFRKVPVCKRWLLLQHHNNNQQQQDYCNNCKLALLPTYYRRCTCGACPPSCSAYYHLEPNTTEEYTTCV